MAGNADDDTDADEGALGAAWGGGAGDGGAGDGGAGDGGAGDGGAGDGGPGDGGPGDTGPVTPGDRQDADDGPGTDSGSGGPLPRAEEVEARGPDQDVEPVAVSTLDRITVVLQDHKSIFTIAVLGYAFFGMPWLVSEGYPLPAYLLGAAFLGGVVLVTVANAHEARDALNRRDERRGF